jgi:hypothetical protein
MGDDAAKRRRGRVGLIALVVATVAAANGVGAQAPAPENVFDVSPSLAIEAARTRLRLFVGENPEPAEGSAPVDRPACPLIAADVLGNIGSVVGTQRGADLRLQLDPWLASTTSDPELRPDSTATGVEAGIPIVRCAADRPADGQVTRPGLSAINLTGGVTFGDVVRRDALEGVLRVQPAGIGGQQVGSCLATDDASVCVVLWSSRGLALRLTLEGPPGAVNTATAGTMLTVAVPTVIDSLAVVLGAAAVCSAEAIGADTAVALLADPLCADGWAFGTTVDCPPPATSISVSDARFANGLRRPDVVLSDCAAVEVFHVQPEGWVYDGLFDTSCTETFTRLGMTVVTASEIAPEPCDPGDRSLSTATIRPDQEGTRVAALQVALVNLGYDLPIDGRYGPLTEAAVVDFQVRNSLIVDGVAGRQTRAALGI